MTTEKDIFVNSMVYPSNFYTETGTVTEQVKPENNSSEKGINIKEKYNSVNKENLFLFLNNKPVTILAFATAFAVGFALKDFVGAFVQNIFQPLLMNLIMLIDRNNYLPFTSYLREKNPQVDIARFLGAILTVKIVIILLYLMNKYENLFLF